VCVCVCVCVSVYMRVCVCVPWYCAVSDSCLLFMIAATVKNCFIIENENLELYFGLRLQLLMLMSISGEVSVT